MNSKFLPHFIAGLFCVLAGLGARTAAAQAAPCSLLSSAQVSAAVGVSVGAAQPIATTGCSWSAPHIIVTLSLWDGNKWDKMKTGLPGSTVNSVAALGDDAFLTTLGRPTEKQFATLSVKKGNTAYVFKVYGPSVSDQTSMEKALAGNVLAKL